MAKKESNFLNMALALVVVAMVASTSLGFIYELTKEPIAAAKLAKKISAIDMVVSPYDNNPVDDMFKLATPGDGDSLEIYPAKKDGKTINYAIRSFSPKGYGGDVWLMVGFDTAGIVTDIAVLDHKETPGLGTKMSSPQFKDQFKGVNPGEFNLKVEKDGGDVDALTGATISSRAFGQAIELAFETMKNQWSNE